ncbi:hypothetical protein J5Y04_40270 [Kitasatospora sp. RG8]|uniref:hypothetical protein n=1 Tax=Kitasatospora sp. RG8 TaxID=2820815 RepID=UPI001AE047E0|nr:hypothetical protein [Kitasatospora sp. RG8]MBP0455715.1 hypothetical protein [Kitasatospora sp. RG8]
MSATRSDPVPPWPMLEGRLSLLKENLERARDFSQTRIDLRGVDVENEVWNATFYDVRRISMSELDNIRGLENQLKARELAPRPAWENYAEIQRRSERAFRECLVLLSGLTLRDRIPDEWVCFYADELIRICSKAMPDVKPRLVVPLFETVLTPARHPTHIRFPEWDIWTLPLVAHELGLASTGNSALTQFVQEALERWNEDHPESGHAGQDAMIARMHVLLADAFGTYALGPAYACALVLLRLDPVPSRQDSWQLARQRALMVRQMLKVMDDGTGLFDHVEETLALDWSGIYGEPPQGMDDGPEPLPLDPVKLKSAFDSVFQANMAYTPKNWETARTWGDQWLADLGNMLLGGARLPDGVIARDKLRDALNAAWHARITDPSTVDEVSTATRALCGKIMEEQSKSMKKGKNDSASRSKPRKNGRGIAKDRAGKGEYG